MQVRSILCSLNDLVMSCFFKFRLYMASKVKQACDGVDVAIALLGTGNCDNTIIQCIFIIIIIILTINKGSDLEREGHDRSDINLPGKQLQLLQDVAAVANGM